MPVFRQAAPSQDSAFDAGWAAQLAAQSEPFGRRIGGRLRLLVGAALLGCVGLFLLAGMLAGLPRIDAHWQAAGGDVVLVSSPIPALAARAGSRLIGLSGAAAGGMAVEPLLLEPSARWLTDDRARARHAELHRALSAAIERPPLTLAFADGTSVRIDPLPARLGRLGPAFWLPAGAALALYLTGAVVALAHPVARNLLYAAMAFSQAAGLVFIAIGSAATPALPAFVARWELAARTGLDLATVAAMVHAAALHPLRLPGARLIAAAAWATALAVTVAVGSGRLDHGWWWTQAAGGAGGLAVTMLLTASYRREPNPAAIVLRRFALTAFGSAALLTLALAAGGRRPDLQLQLAGTGSAAWMGLVASLLMVLPFLTKPQHLIREFALLAVITTVATALDLLLLNVFSIGRFASLTLALFFTLAIYVGTRQWILGQLLGSHLMTAERTFSRLYRTVREVEERPQQMPAFVCALLRDLFRPLQVDIVEARPSHARASSDGSVLIVPLPWPAAAPAFDDEPAGGSVVMRFAHRGRRLFTTDDARLADSVVEQLRRALAFAQAVEQGRTEERLRLAQDLHDDIGARLLTLMYQAPSTEIEDYLRRTLQDLKTLTRGLAAPTHRLGDAAAEWKADLSQRFALARIELDWQMRFDDDMMLSVVQWSALTRILRELVSNVIAHAGATQVAVRLDLEGERLQLMVADDGIGGDPAGWSHGLGLGGVRKRVKQLGGEVEWSRVEPRGIRCRVTVARL